MRTGRLAPVGLIAWVISARYMSASLGTRRLGRRDYDSETNKTPEHV